MDKSKVLVYPYDLDFCSILRHKELFKGYEIKALVSPRGWGIAGNDAGTADNGDDLGIKISSDFEGNLDLCDTVLICESSRTLDFESVIKPKIIKAVECKKNIIIALSIACGDIDSISGKCTEKGVDFKYFGSMKEEVDFQGIPEESEFLHDIGTPVVFVTGIGERTNKFEVQLSLRENIKEMGYKISQIGSRGYCELLGFHSFPSFMFSKKISETNKIVLFNHFVKSIETEEQPDLIIIGIPGGIMPLSKSLTNRFGVLAYEISQAVTPDSTVFTCYCEEYLKEFFIKMRESARIRLGLNIDCFNISNVMLDWGNSKEINRVNYLSLKKEDIHEKMRCISSLGQPVFNVLEEKDAAQMSEYIIKTLTEYSEAKCI